MILDLAFSSPSYHDNAARCSGDAVPCVICGKPVKEDRKTKMVRVHKGGAAIVTEAEARALNEQGEAAADMGAYPIGPECRKKHARALAGYLAAGSKDHG